MPVLRTVRAEDGPFLHRLFVSIRGPEFAATDLAPAALSSLLAMQRDAQDDSYRREHPGADVDLIIIDSQPAGRLTVDREPGRIHVVEIGLLPEYRGRGTGTWLLTRLLEEGQRSGRSVTLNVVRTGRALVLYRRLGFVITGGDDVYLEMATAPGPVS